MNVYLLISCRSGDFCSVCVQVSWHFFLSHLRATGPLNENIWLHTSDSSDKCFGTLTTTTNSSIIGADCYKWPWGRDFSSLPFPFSHLFPLSSHPSPFAPPLSSLIHFLPFLLPSLPTSPYIPSFLVHLVPPPSRHPSCLTHLTQPMKYLTDTGHNSIQPNSTVGERNYVTHVQQRFYSRSSCTPDLQPQFWRAAEYSVTSGFISSAATSHVSS